MKEEESDMQSTPVEYTCHNCGVVEWDVEVVVKKKCKNCQEIMNCEEEIDDL